MNVVTSQNLEVFKNVISEKQTWQLLLQSKKMEAVGSLAGGLAHDFNNILTSIHASAQCLRMSRPLTPEEEEVVSDIEHQVICGAEVVKQLLMFTKPDRRTNNGKTTLLNQHILMFRRMLKRIMPKNIVIALDLADSEISVKISVSELEQILLNLLINARDAMPEGGAIRIKSRIARYDKSHPCPIPNVKHGTYAQLEVADAGKGIKAKQIPRLFEPYYSSKHNNGGTGLGLAIVYSIIQRNKGYIMVSSVASAGTVFSIFLPARKAQKRQTEKAKARHEEFLGGGETILLAEDEPIIAKSTSHFLQRYGYRIITAKDGKAAIAEFKKNRKNISLLLLDIEMPEMDGLSCLKELRAIDPKVKVIAMSGHFIKPDAWDPSKAGAKAFLQKPFESQTLLKTIRSTLNGASSV